MLDWELDLMVHRRLISKAHIRELIETGPVLGEEVRGRVKGGHVLPQSQLLVQWILGVCRIRVKD